MDELFPPALFVPAQVATRPTFVFACTTRDGAPAEGARLSVACPGAAPVEATSDAEGALAIALGPELFAPGCRAVLERARGAGPVSLRVALATHLRGAEDGTLRVEPAGVVELRQLRPAATAAEGLGVYAVADVAAGVEDEALGWLVAADASVRAAIGLDLPPTAVALCGGPAWTCAAGTPYRQAWACDVGPDGRAPILDVAWTVTHERVEDALRGTLVTRRGSDPRWVYDGIAEWAGFMALRAASAVEARRAVEGVVRSLGSLHEPVDLLAWRSVQGLTTTLDGRLGEWGYAPALAFWLEVASSERVVRDFVSVARQHGRLDDARLVELLAQASGRDPRELRSALASYAPARALAVLERAVAPGRGL
jgi:hypothetical protein